VLNILLYSLIFFAYAALRIRKALLKRNEAGARLIPFLCAGLLILTCSLSLYRWNKAEVQGSIQPAADWIRCVQLASHTA
jgi:hypothetical protein